MRPCDRRVPDGVEHSAAMNSDCRSVGSASRRLANRRSSGLYGAIAAFAAETALIPGSSVVEQAAVNRWVAGSNPARGANQIGGLDSKAVRPPERCQAAGQYSRQYSAEFMSHETGPKAPLAHRPPPGEAEGEASTPASQGCGVGVA
jgi:hypothetical protein